MKKKLLILIVIITMTFGMQVKGFLPTETDPLPGDGDNIYAITTAYPDRGDVQLNTYITLSSYTPLHGPDTLRWEYRWDDGSLITVYSQYYELGRNCADIQVPSTQGQHKLYVTGYDENGGTSSKTFTYNVVKTLHAHTYGEWVIIKNATCTTTGSQERACSICSDTEIQIIPSGHKYGDWTITTKVTCQADGSRKRTCTICSKDETQIIPKEDHNYVYAGYEGEHPHREYNKCTKCESISYIGTSKTISMCSECVVTDKLPGAIYFMPYNINTLITYGTPFSKATINVTGIDNSGDYKYVGIDIGIFKKPKTGSTWKAVYVQRRITENATIEVKDFGNISLYSQDDIYVLGYRLLYRCIEKGSPVDLSSTNPIIEMDWKKINGGYFVLDTLPNSKYINKVSHNQIINTFANKHVIAVNGTDKVVVSDTDTPINSEVKNVLGTLNGYNTFIDGDSLYYIVEFNVSSSNEISDVIVDFDYNVNNEIGIELKLKEVELYKKQSDGSYMLIKANDKFKVNKIGRKDRYNIALGKDSSGNSIIQSNGDGVYQLKYKVDLVVDISYTENQDFVLQNESHIKILGVDGNLLERVEEEFEGNKNYIRTKIKRGIMLQ